MQSDKTTATKMSKKPPDRKRSSKIVFILSKYDHLSRNPKESTKNMFSKVVGYKDSIFKSQLYFYILATNN